MSNRTPKFEAGKLLEGEQMGQRTPEELDEELWNPAEVNRTFEPFLLKELGNHVQAPLRIEFDAAEDIDFGYRERLETKGLPERSEYANLYTLNPRNLELNYGQLEMAFVEEPEDSHSASSAVERILELYPPNSYYYPGVEYAKWLLEHPDQAPQELADGTRFLLLPGSCVHTSTGALRFPVLGVWNTTLALFASNSDPAIAGERRVLLFKRPPGDRVNINFGKMLRKG